MNGSQTVEEEASSHTGQDLLSRVTCCAVMDFPNVWQEVRSLLTGGPTEAQIHAAVRPLWEKRHSVWSMACGYDP